MADGESFFFTEAIRSLEALTDLDLDPEDMDQIKRTISKLIVLRHAHETYELRQQWRKSPAPTIEEEP